MKCPKCQTENTDARKFCRECGISLSQSCSECGHENHTSDKFCGRCGEKIEISIEAEIPKIQSQGERKHVTALFSDLSGYTAMSEKLDPEEVKEITNRIFGDISQIIGNYDGFIEKYAGDAVMALFGAKTAHEDDPVRAIRAARDIHRIVESISPEYEAKIGQPLKMHTGINTGLVVTGEINYKKGTHGVAGDTINIAARLSNLGEAGEILVGPDTFKQAEGYFDFETLAPAVLKGKTESIEIYKALSPKKKPSKVHRPLGLKAELIGRATEMAQLQEAVAKLQKGAKVIISLSGDAGTGKSRLIEEFKKTLDLNRIRWHEGHAYAYSQSIPYFPITDLLRRLLQVDEQEHPATLRKKIQSGIIELAGEKTEIIPYIGNLFALSYPETEDISPEFWKTRLYDAIQEIISALASKDPIIISLEDLHWADPSTIELVRFLLSRFEYPALFLMIHRPGFDLFEKFSSPELLKISRAIKLHDLTPSESQDMVGSLLKVESIPPDLIQFLKVQVEGNPFYVEEVINSLIESGILIHDNDHWELTREVSDSEIPPTIQGLIGGRLDRLAQETKCILQEASVIGRVFLFKILKQITDLNYQIDQCLSDLESLDLIKTKTLEPDLEYIFKHALTQETVYSGLLKKERREIHERIGRVIETLFQDRLPEFYEMLAYHFTKGQSQLKAVDYLIKSGDKSLKRYALEEAHQYFIQAYDVLKQKSGKTREERATLLEILNKWAHVFYFRGDVDGFMELLKAHESDAELSDDEAIRGMFYAWFGWALGMQENVKESFDYLYKALAIGEKIENQIIIGYACTWLVYSCMEGLLDKGLLYGERAHQIANIVKSDQYLFFKSLCGMGHIYYQKGECKKVSEIGRILIDYGKKKSHIRSLSVGHICMGYSNETAGDFPAAIECYQQAMAVAKDPIYVHWAGLFKGLAHIQIGQYTQAEKAIQELVNYSREFGCGILGRMAYASYGVILIEKGQMSRGFKMIEESRRSSLQNDREYINALIEFMLGKVYLQMVESDKPVRFTTLLKNLVFIIKHVPKAGKKSEGHFKKAIEIATRIHADGLIGQASLNLGILFKAKRQNQLAKGYLSAAIKIFTKGESRAFLKQAKETLASLN